jgi:exodeoxyribonuclease VIII
MITIKSVKEEFLKSASDIEISKIMEAIGDDKIYLMLQFLDAKGELKGIYKDIPDHVYHRCIGLSRSGLLLFDKDPVQFHYKYILKNDEDESTDAFDFGTICHEMILNPDQFHKTYFSDKFAAILGKRTTKKYKNAIYDFKNEFPERKIIHDKIYKSLMDIKNSIYSNPFIEKILKAPGYCEHTVFWTDPISKVLLKCRPDKLILGLDFDDYKTKNFILDLKTTKEIFAFESAISKFKYYIQHPWYTDGTKYALGIKDLQLLFIAVDKRKPHYSRIGQLDIAGEGLGCTVARNMLDKFSNALQNGFIPTPRVETFNLPDYEFKYQENKKEIENHD